MARLRATLLLAGIAFALSQTPETALAQGKGGAKDQGGGHGQAKGQGKGEGKGQAKRPEKVQKQGGSQASTHAAKPSSGSGRSRSEVAKVFKNSGNGKANIARFANSNRRQDVIATAAIAHANRRGHGDDFRIEDAGNRIRIINRNGDELVDLDDQSARNLGRWRVGVLDNQVRDGAPSFCRSGAGHPVWGREWCIDKGFGLGSYEDYRWGRTNDIGDIFFSPSGYGNSIVGNALVNLLGTTAFNRLALHAVTLGLLEPLTGRWVSQPTGPQMLMVNSGPYPVAELVDTNRDNRVENILFALLTGL